MGNPYAGSHMIKPFEDVCCWPECQAEADGSGAPLCRNHLARAYRTFKETYVALLDDVADNTLARALANPPTTKLSERPGHVYFVRFQGLIKIGFTTNMPSRMQAIPHEELLAAVPGQLADEKRCHAAFAHLREQGEWFRPEPDLLACIAEVTAKAS